MARGYVGIHPPSQVWKIQQIAAVVALGSRLARQMWLQLRSVQVDAAAQLSSMLYARELSCACAFGTTQRPADHAKVSHCVGQPQKPGRSRLLL